MKNIRRERKKEKVSTSGADVHATGVGHRVSRFGRCCLSCRRHYYHLGRMKENFVYCHWTGINRELQKPGWPFRKQPGLKLVSVTKIMSAGKVLPGSRCLGVNNLECSLSTFI